MYFNRLKNKEKIFAVAPMMDWTDRHCRFFHRLLTKRSLLYTEMVVADAIIHGDADRHLDFDPSEHPVALQLGGSEPSKLRQAAAIAARYGYDEINLNVGCPSDRVQSGTFGACLMREPQTVAQCVDAIKQVVDVPVTVKCRIGVDDQDPQLALDDFAGFVFSSGCDALWVHARKAWLQGLSPKENRDIPPLNYDRVHRLKADWPDRFVGINGGLRSCDEALAQLTVLDGVMVGRAAYQTPNILRDVDRLFYGEEGNLPEVGCVCEAMMSYASDHIARGGRLHHVTRHMIGLFSGLPGARRYRQILSVEACREGVSVEVIAAAFGAVHQARAVA